MRPEAQLSVPMNWDTSVYDSIFWEEKCVLFSPEPWILGRKLSPAPSITKAPETGYPELVLV